MSLLHLIFGVAVLIVFLVTGRFMRLDFPDKDAIPPELRILMRSRHIYILFSSLIHVLLGLYYQKQTQIWQKSVQMFGSFLLISSSVLLVWAFVYETYAARHFTDISRWGIYLTLAATVFHLFGNAGRKKI